MVLHLPGDVNDVTESLRLFLQPVGANPHGVGRLLLDLLDDLFCLL